MKEQNIANTAELSRMQKEQNERDSDYNKTELCIREATGNLEDLNNQKQKIFELMEGEWNDDTIPGVEEFMEKINKIRSDIVDLTE